MSQQFPLASPRRTPKIFLAIMIVIVFALVGVVIASIPGPSKFIFLVVWGPLLWFLCWTLMRIELVEFRVDGKILHMSGPIYRCQVPLAAIRTVDLRSDVSLVATIRTNGCSLPGYQSGWYKLRNGEKALMYLTDRSRVTYIPTDLGYALIVRSNVEMILNLEHQK